MQFSGIIRAWKGRSNSTENPSCAGTNSEGTLTSAFGNNLFYSKWEDAGFHSCILVSLLFFVFLKQNHICICVYIEIDIFDKLDFLMYIHTYTYICGIEISLSQIVVDVPGAELTSQKSFQKSRLIIFLYFTLPLEKEKKPWQTQWLLKFTFCCIAGT